MMPYPFPWRLITATSAVIALAFIAPHAFATSATSDATPIAATSTSTAFSFFRSSTFKFSLAYPSDLTETDYDEGEGSETIVIQDDAKPIGFQMFITPDDEQTISATSLADDFPTLQITYPKITTVGTGTPAIAFASNAPTSVPPANSGSSTTATSSK